MPVACHVIDTLRPAAQVPPRKRKKYALRKIGHGRINPRTKAEWQEAVNTAHWALAVDSAFQYGLIQWSDGSTESAINVDRCLRLLEQGKKRGLVPDENWNP